ncbi:dipeptidase [Achromobacter aloeverae]|uniref:Peptidase M19 n=1 Tax=Achromobacter aloeverae TaxID=1750518 RepID=A0A4Q1HQL7_9BURK|nr:membrane dipeptidase [Achromobacter aloeverae]RXN92696.1 peptidase M19 [Achromobacter aloeverae]
MIQVLSWDAIYAGAEGVAPDAWVRLDGHPVFPDAAQAADTFLLVQQAACCATHGCWHADMVVEVHADAPVDWRSGPVSVRGRWERLIDDPAGWRYRIRAAQVVPVREPRAAWAIGRRSVLGLAAFAGLGAMAGLAGCAPAQGGDGAPGERAGQPGAANPAVNGAANGPVNGPVDRAEPDAQPAIPAWLATQSTVDIHSHGGRVSLGRRPVPLPFTALAAPMRAGAMHVVCLAIVTDSSADHVVTSPSGRRRIVAYRDPAPGEMAARGEAGFQRLADLVAQQNLHVVTTAAQLRAACRDGPSVIVSAEGADFLEGDLARLDDAYHRHGLRHLQLTHYRVNELGDIQTAPPVHQGLTDFGAAVIERCNDLGIVVDVAHGTYALVERAARVTRRPLVLSHTSLSPHPGRYSRTISPAHARLVADTCGVIGVWPVAGTFPTLAAMAQGMRALADEVGVAHVGLGSDMLGLLGPSVLDSYRKLPLLAQALRDAGFSEQDASAILGGNYARVHAATMKA